MPTFAPVGSSEGGDAAVALGRLGPLLDVEVGGGVVWVTLLVDGVCVH